MIILAVLVLLTTVDGRQIYVNPDLVVSVVVVREERLATGGHCVLNFVDGKFITVSEDCDTVRRKMGK